MIKAYKPRYIPGIPGPKGVGHTNDWCISTGQVHEPPELPGMGAPGVLGIWGEWLFIFRELGSTGNF